jgi:hypothetical protein
LVFKTKTVGDWQAMITLAETDPTEVITGYGIWKTTEDKVPMVVQRRHAQRTTFVWAVSLDGSPVNLQANNVESDGARLEQSHAVLVRAGSGDRNLLLLANPQRKSIDVSLPDGTHWKTDAVFSVR